MNPEFNFHDLDQKIRILNGAENIVNFIISRYTYIRKSIVVCDDYLGPITIKKTVPIWKANLELDKRGIKVRFLTDIRNKNVKYCKEMLGELNNLEIRHMSGVKGNFSIFDDREIFTIFVDKPGKPVNDAIFCTQKGMVAVHLFAFENIWSQATPAHLRFKELEGGRRLGVLQTIRDPNEIIETAYRLVKSARKEILIVFHTANALLRQERAGRINLLVEKAVKHKTQIKILVPMEDGIVDILQRLKHVNNIHIRNIEPTMQTKMTVLVIDRKYSLVKELRDDTEEDSLQAMGIATYSNSESTVLSYVSIFDTLWKQTELREELTSRSIAQNEFINIAAHELRNPIQPILGLSDILQRSELIVENDKEQHKLEQQKEMIDIIARNAKRLQRLTEDILDVTKIEGKTLKLNKERFVLSEAVSELVEEYTMDTRSSNRNIIISFSSSNDLESNNVTIVADQDRIKQVIRNLIDNAIKFTEMGRIAISTSIDKKYNHAIVNVEDTGKGIDPEILPKLFTKFATKSDRGTGLGLYISKGILEAHGGKMWAINNSKRYANENHNGATFGFSLPLD